MPKPALTTLIGVVSLAVFTASTAAPGEQKAPEGSQQASHSGYASEVPADDAIQDKSASAVTSDGNQTTIPVAEEVDFVLQSGFRAHENFDNNLKKVARLDYFGARYVGCQQYSAEVHTARPNSVRTVIAASGEPARLELSRAGDKTSASGPKRGLSLDMERVLLEAFDFDTPIVDLERDKHSYTPIGMEKLPGILAWKLRADLPQGNRRIVYVDSHTGDVVKFTIVDAKGAKILDVVQHDFRVIEGLRLPFAVDYRSPSGKDLANDRFQRVVVGWSRS